ncbi:MAG TPA: phospho-N-acetylmuramoyl-pentapeptide-transferase [Oligoflexia bacterium]|nr:phospho-N-acetylmuramoyl-pentapeptide-transferase [Oligoflexia bacterium]HMP47740.1 phospho-N-acetylmuramoyl-pentapeptide-transferase [Oligoflexia bacterium]
MLYHLFLWLQSEWSTLNVFRYLTFRSILGFFISLCIVLVFQPFFINWFRERRIGQPIRNDGPEAHLIKAGTPTMGGLVVVVAVIVSTLLLADLGNFYVWLLCGLTASYGILGFLDDYSKLKYGSSRGISARAKFFWQSGLAFVFVSALVLFVPGYSTEISMPFFKNATFDISYLYILFGVLVIVGASNAVNLTDGLDGLVIGPVMTVSFAYGIFAYVTGNVKTAEYLQIGFISGVGDLSIFAAALVAGGLGFLWYNSFPAQIFMGDVGALALGGALGFLAIIVKQELVLVIAGGIFVVEALSVMLQVGSYKLRGKRIFRMAPLHHHYELKGMSEPKIIVRAWIISIVLAIVSIATLKLR